MLCVLVGALRTPAFAKKKLVPTETAAGHLLEVLGVFHQNPIRAQMQFLSDK